MAAQWTPDMTTGIEELDQQHQVLIARLNEFADALQSGVGARQVGELLDFCQTYAEQHFAVEEAHMERLDCPAALANLRGHAYFRRRFAALTSKVASGSRAAGASIEAVRELTAWLTNHILTVDTELAKV